MTPVAQRALFRPKSVKLTMPRIGVIDVETEGLGGKALLWGMLGPDDEYTTTRDVCELWSIITARRYRGVLWYAHNGGKYDFLYLARFLADLQVNGQVSAVKPIIGGGERLIGLTIHRTAKDRHPIQLWDSYALLPDTLERITDVLAPEYHKRPIDFDTTVFDPDNVDHLAYLRIDCQGLKSSLIAYYRHIHDSFGVLPGISSGNTALRAFRNTIPADQIYFRPREEVEDFCRQCYYGGQVYLTDVGVVHRDMLKLDINGAYAYAMANYELPLGKAVKTDEYKEENHVGFYKCTVIAPNNAARYIVPYRRHETLLWPRGQFTSYLDSYTIEYAKSRGYTITIEEGYYFLHKRRVLQDFVTKCENIEVSHKGDAIGYCVKQLRNSLYGKFGTSRHRREYAIGKGVREGYTPLPDENGYPHPFLAQREVEIESACMMPHWAAIIAAGARIYLDMVNRVFEYSACYNDTDSLVVARECYERHKQEIHNYGYGSLKIEAEYTSFTVMAPKTYRGTLSGNDEDFKAKGIPKRARKANHPESDVYSFTQIASFVQVLAGRPIGSLAERTLSDIAHSTAWELQADGHTVLPPWLSLPP